MIELPQILQFDVSAEVAHITEWIRTTLARTLRRQGVVIGVSGGVDSATTAALCARAIGPERVYALLMPDRESGAETSRLARHVVAHLEISNRTIDITSTLDSLGVYRDRDEIVRRLDPQAHTESAFKIIIGDNDTMLSHFTLVTESGGDERRTRLDAADYLGIVAATNYKQRVRKSIEYHYADLLNYAVVGTPNRLEYDQGFFVKGGDGAADFKPIAHLYKSQVYAVADHRGLPADVLNQKPTTDTYSLDQSQEEFYFGLPLREMDICLYGLNNALSAGETAQHAGLPVEQVTLAWRRIEQKRRSTKYLHLSPLLARGVPEVSHE